MRRAFVAASRTAFKAIYRLSRKAERQDMAVFLSRQTNEPSYDFAELARELEGRGWKCVMHLKKVRARNIVPYVAHVVREIHLLGKCKLAVLDRYDPVVCLLDFENDDVPAPVASEARAKGRRNLDFPRKPVVLQMWHAFGAYKKFGHQSVGTLEGHSASFTSAYDIHRNYSYVLCSGSGAREAFAEAFSCPTERVIPLVRPEYDELKTLSAQRAAKRAVGCEIKSEDERETNHMIKCEDERHDECPVDKPSERLDSKPSERDVACSDERPIDKPFSILMAPTLRKSKESAHPFRDLYETRDTFESGIDATFTWSFHPLEEGLPAPGNVSSKLVEADCLVTDYSSIVYEACVLGIPVIFYVPDLESYRVSPGLNADPQRLCPELCVYDSDELKARLQSLANSPDTYPQTALAAFAASGFDPETDDLPGTAASRIVDFCMKQVAERFDSPCKSGA